MRLIRILHSHTNRALVIEVPIEKLVFYAEHHPDFYDYDLDCGTVRVDDQEAFVQSIASELKEEDEDGSTLVTRMLDKAILDMIEHGGEGCSQPAPKEDQ